MLLIVCVSAVLLSFLFVLLTQSKLGRNKVAHGAVGKTLDILNPSEVHWFTSQDNNPGKTTIIVELM